jgi:aquaporin Z
VVTVQILLDLILIGFFVRFVVGAVQKKKERTVNVSSDKEHGSQPGGERYSESPHQASGRAGTSPATRSADGEHRRADAIGDRFLIRFEENTLRQRPLSVRVIVEFLGTFILVTVAAGAGVINRYAGHGPISRTAAVIAPGAVVMAMIYALGPLSGLHINPAVTLAFAGRRVFKAAWIVPYLAAQLAGAVCAALVLQVVFGHVTAGGNYPIAKPGGDWRSLVMEIVLTAILVTVILHTATGYRSIGHNAALAVGATVAMCGLFASPISGASMNPARTLGPDVVGAHFTGWWIYVIGPGVGAIIAVATIGVLRGRPDEQELEAAEGGALPLKR